MYRGSVPLFWSHEKIGYQPKPKIIINETKDPNYLLSIKHFEGLFRRYGDNIHVLNLVK